ncbi:uncharacterized protein LOC120352282 [Nilaparvata lugens]|uniref:uncharacterized protein LOC120352282 n=1 Tax=Nilaparvata lugens TaxID=108931 RepID=UPI00193CA609|nr:uncharacterized protein LOC120352282 [Nilaparvata lugens]
MSFSLYKTTRNNDAIYYDKNCYRKSHSLSSGDIVWRCVHKGCSSTITTDKSLKNFKSSANSHVKHATQTPPQLCKNSLSKSVTIDTAEKTTNRVITCRMSRLSVDSSLKNIRKALSFDVSSQTDPLFLQDKDVLIERINELLGYQDALIAEIQSLKHPECVPSHSPTTQCVAIQTESLSTDSDDQHYAIANSNFISLNKTKDKLYKEIINLEHDIAENRSIISSLELERENLANIISKVSQEVELVGKLVVSEDCSESLGQTSESKIRNIIEHVRGKIIIFSDSQGRDLASYLQNRIPHSYSVSSFVYPGAGMCQILDRIFNCKEVQLMNKEDYLIILGGTNDINDSANEKDTIIFRLAVESLLRQTRHTNVIIGTVPYRYDMPAASPINCMIKVINGLLKKIVSGFVTLLNTWDLTAKEHTSHGLHINKKGKIKIARRLDAIIRDSLDRKKATSSSNLYESMIIELTTGPCLEGSTSLIGGEVDAVVPATGEPDVALNLN